MAASRRHWKFLVRDAYGYVIQNARVNVYLPGTTTVFSGTAYNADSGGGTVTNPFTTNAQGEVEAWFDTAQVVDIAVSDNTGTAYRAVDGAGGAFSFTPFTEFDEIVTDPIDLPTTIGTAADLTDITAALQSEVVGSSGRWAPMDHVHGHSAFSANPHGIADHTDITKKLWLPVNDGVVIDGGTLTITGAGADVIRTISLADAAVTGAAWSFVFDDWASGVVSAQIYWAGSTTNANPVRWQLETKTIAAGADITAAGTAVAFTSNQASVTANFLVKDTLTSTTITPANGDLLKLGVRRLGTDGADLYTGAALVIGVMLSYTAVQ